MKEEYFHIYVFLYFISHYLQRTSTCNLDFPSRGEVQGVQETQPPILFDGNMTNQVAPPVRCQARKGDLACIVICVVSAPGSRYGRFASGHERTSSSQRLLWYSQVLFHGNGFQSEIQISFDLVCHIWPNPTLHRRCL